MADSIRPIDLPAAGAFSGTDVLIVDQGAGGVRKVLGSQVTNFLGLGTASKEDADFFSLAETWTENLINLEVPDYVDVIQTNGYAEPGDGGGATFRRVDANPGHPGSYQSADGAWWEILETVLTPEMFGAKRNGIDYDNDAIHAAIATQQALEWVTEVRLLGGLYLLDTTPTNGVLIEDVENLRFVGAGKNRTILKIDDDTGGQTLQVRGSKQVYIAHLTVDGNRANQSVTGHGIRIADVEDLTIEHVVVQNAYSYGIGMQDDQLVRVRLHDVHVINSGMDGIDIKNKANLNIDCSMDTILVDGFGAQGGNDFAGVDIRGPWECSNIVVRNALHTECSGIRFRQGVAEETNGIGGHRSNLVNFRVEIGSTVTTGAGVDIAATDVRIANGYVSGGQHGIRINSNAPRAMISNVTAEDCSGSGIIANGEDGEIANFTAKNCALRGANVTGNSHRFVNFAGVGCDEAVRIAGNDHIFVNLLSRDCVTRAVQLLSGASRNRIIGGLISGSSTVLDSGTDTTIKDVTGYSTENKGSAEITSGNTSVTVTHGLSVAPAAGDILVTATSDWGAAAKCWVSDVTSTDFKINVDADPAATVSFNWWAKVKGAA